MLALGVNIKLEKQRQIFMAIQSILLTALYPESIKVSHRGSNAYVTKDDIELFKRREMLAIGGNG